MIDAMSWMFSITILFPLALVKDEVKKKQTWLILRVNCKPYRLAMLKLLLVASLLTFGACATDHFAIITGIGCSEHIMNNPPIYW